MSDTFRSIEDRLKDYRRLIRAVTLSLEAEHEKFENQVAAGRAYFEANEAKLRIMEDELAKLEAEKAQIDAANEANP